MHIMKKVVLVGCVAAIGSVATVHAQIHEVTGKAGAVNAATSGRLEREPVRSIRIGSEVYVSERIRTDANGRTQLLFLDGTRILVYPNSEIVLNRVKLDRQPAQFQVAISLVAGDFWLTSPGTPLSSPAAANPTTPNTPSPGVDGTMQSASARVTVSVDPTAAASDYAATTPPDVPDMERLEKRTNIRFPSRQPIVEFYSVSGPVNLVVSKLPGGALNALNLGTVPLSFTVRANPPQLLRPNFSLAISAAGDQVRIGRTSGDTFSRIARVSGSSTERSFAGASDQVGPITARNSARQAAELVAPTSLNALDQIDPRRLDILAGVEPGQLGTVRQQASVTDRVNAVNAVSLTAALTGLQSRLPATGTANLMVSGPGGMQAATIANGPSGLTISPPSVTVTTLSRLGRPGTLTVTGPTVGNLTIPLR